MTTYKRWPIGLQTSPTGKALGIGQVIRDLTDAGIAMFSAASDSMDILFDLQKEHKETGVPHTGNYIPTGYVDGYHLSVPEYRTPHSRELAERHWNAVEKRGLPPEIDWNIPCIWLSTWNEIRPYVGWGSMAWLEDWETPVDGYEGYADLIGWQAVEIGKVALERGYRWAAFGFAGGNPEPGFWEAPGILEYLRLCDQHPDQLGVALHEYSLHDSLIDRPDHIGRFQQLHAVSDRHGLRRPVIQIKEFGWHERWVPEPDQALPELIQVADLYMEHPNIHGAAIWTVSGGWSNLFSRVQKLIPHFSKMARDHARMIKELEIKKPLKKMDKAEAAGFESSIPLDNVPAGTPFSTTWTFKNSGESTWDGRYEFAYSDIAHPSTTMVSRSPLDTDLAHSITAVGAPPQVKPGQEMHLTLQFRAPNAPGAYGSNWQLQAPDGRRFGPIRWLQPVVSEPSGPLEEVRHDYQWLSFENSEINYNSMAPGMKFSGTWIIKNTGTHAWTADFHAAYVKRSTPDSADALRHRMGGKSNYTLRELTGRDRIDPGEQVPFRFDLVAPQQTGLYAFHWELRTPDGTPFGTTRWLQIGVRATGVDPDKPKDPAPLGHTYFGMNINPNEEYVEDIERMRGLGWVRYVYWASREGNSPATAFHKRYREVIQRHAAAGIKSLIILHQDTEWGGNLRDQGDWEGYARVFARACAGVARACAEFSDMIAYQIYNETDSGYEADTGNFNKSAIGIAPEDYALILDHAQRAIREVDPQATIVMGGMKTGPDNAVGYIKAVQKKLGGRLPVDALACHPYGRYVNFAPFNYGQIGPLSYSLQAFRKAFPDLPLWITEIGTPGGDKALDPVHYPTIARYMNEVVEEIANNHADHVPVLIWFAWSDKSEYAGMITRDGKMKPHLAEAFQNMLAIGRPPKPKALSLEALEQLVDSEYVSFSTTLANYNAVPAGTTFTNRWTFRNTGGQTWGEGYKLVFAPAAEDVHPDPLSENRAYNLADVASPMPAEPGGEVVITLELKAPDLFGRSYVGRWELRDPGGERFGFCYAEITVVPPLTAGTNVRESGMAFVADKSVPDGTRFIAGSDFNKQWLVRNTGTRHWGSGFRLNFVQGDSHMARGKVSHIVPPAKPGEEVILSIPMIAPPVANGRATAYNSLWRMQDDRGNVFGDPIWARIVSTPAIDVSSGEGSALARLLNDRTYWYSQRDPRWADDKLGFGEATIGSWGCLMTCMAMTLSAFGHPFNPPDLNDKLKELGNNGFRGSSVQFIGPSFIGRLSYKGNVASWEEHADENAIWTGEHPIERIDNALAAGHIVVTQVDTKPNNGLFDSNIEQHWVIITQRTPEGDDYLIIDPLTPPQQIDQQPFSLMEKYGIKVPSLENEVNLRNSIRSTLVYHQPGGSGW
ncbi:MAG: NBR1-Ig-like domain-containing protein [Candidatus Promineifilaceae bacterium]|nr:NBR1-Ig-like domain-containing protein [Candidatus Promineifilaceae bacterium]